MSLSLRMIVVLTTVGLIAGGLLSVVNLLTAERIELNRLREIEEAITQVVPGTVAYEIRHEEEGFTVYAAQGTGGNDLGYAVYASGTGFQDIIKIMFGTDPAVDKIYSLTVLEQKETPGLGAKITDRNAFLRFWEDRDVRQPLALRKPAAASPQDLSASEVNTITGATISSQKVLDTVNLSLERLRGVLQEGKRAKEDQDGD